MSDSVRPHRRQPTRLSCPWDSPGKSSSVGCHFLLQCVQVKTEKEVTQFCLTLRPYGQQPTSFLCPWDFPGKKFNSWVGKIHWRKDRLPTPVFLGFLVIQLVKNLPIMQETLVRSLGLEDPLQKGKANCQHLLDHRKSKRIPEKHLLLLY